MDQQYYSPANSEGVSIDSIDRKDSADINTVTNPKSFNPSGELEPPKKPVNTRSLNRERFVPSKEAQNQTAKSALDKMFADLDLSKSNGNSANYPTYDFTAKPVDGHQPNIAPVDPVEQVKPPVASNTGSSFEINEKGEIVFINPIPDLNNFGMPMTTPLVSAPSGNNGALPLADDDFFLLLAQGPAKSGNQQTSSIPAATSKPGLGAPPKKVDTPATQPSLPSKPTSGAHQTKAQLQTATPAPAPKPTLPTGTTTTTATPGLSTAVKTLVLQAAQPANPSPTAGNPSSPPLSVAVTK